MLFHAGVSRFNNNSSYCCRNPDLWLRFSGQEPHDFSEKCRSYLFILKKNLSLWITLAVDNPNPVGITLKKLAFDVFYQKGDDWIYLSSGKQSDVVIKSGKNDLSIPINTSNTELFGAFFDMIAHGKITLQVKGFASPDLFLCAPEVPFTHTRTIPLALPGR
jgi:hypothetical protein